tara:strand:- start:5419 stop:6006 length:588 start_codon:yes stop_codon:yes gene_type:complete
MSKIWFFGDSFTYGWGARPGFEYFEKNKSGEIWTSAVAKNLNLEEKNLATPGKFSNDLIINKIITNITNISSNDIVIFSDTDPLRCIRVQDGKIKGFNPNNVRNKKIGTKVFGSQYYNALDYLYYMKYSNLELFENYYSDYFLSLADIFTHLGIKNYFWSYKERENYSKIPNDGHFDWNGHKKFTKFILNAIRQL